MEVISVDLVQKECVFDNIKVVKPVYVLCQEKTKLRYPNFRFLSEYFRRVHGMSTQLIVRSIGCDDDINPATIDGKEVYLQEQYYTSGGNPIAYNPVSDMYSNDVLFELESNFVDYTKDWWALDGDLSSLLNPSVKLGTYISAARGVSLKLSTKDPGYGFYRGIDRDKGCVLESLVHEVKAINTLRRPTCEFDTYVLFCVTDLAEHDHYVAFKDNETVEEVNNYLHEHYERLVVSSKKVRTYSRDLDVALKENSVANVYMLRYYKELSDLFVHESDLMCAAASCRPSSPWAEEDAISTWCGKDFVLESVPLCGDFAWFKDVWVKEHLVG